MKIRHLLGIVAVLALCAQDAVHAVDKVIISYSSRSYAFLPAQVGCGAEFLQR
jgi:hypothetical protein